MPFEAAALATLEGTVVAGDGRGRGLGFPTANLRLEMEGELPRGVFAASVSWAGAKDVGRAVVNIGCRPTFGASGLVVEVHVLDFDGNLYGRRLWVRLERQLREERRFESAEALVRQIERDIALARSP